MTRTTASQIAKAVAIAATCVERRVTIPILECIRIDGNVVSGTDLDIEIRATFAAEELGFAGCIPAHRLSALLNLIPGEQDVDFTGSDAGAILRSGQGAYRLPIMAATDYPDMAHPKGRVKNVHNFAVADHLKKIAYAISTEETRYYLKGAWFGSLDDEPVIAAMDGHRLAVVRVPGAPWGGEGQSFILPRNAVHRIMRLGNPTEMMFADMKALFRWPGVELVAKTIDSQYPDIARVIPKNDKTITVDADALRVAVRRVGLLAGVYTRSPYIGFVAKGDKISVVARGGDTSAVETLDADTGGETGPLFGLSANYVRTVLNGKSGPVTLRYADNAMPIRCDTDALTEVFMPPRSDALEVDPVFVAKPVKVAA